eukprot:2486216-Amphidinium_carterae.1
MASFPVGKLLKEGNKSKKYDIDLMGTSFLASLCESRPLFLQTSISRTSTRIVLKPRRTKTDN